MKILSRYLSILMLALLGPGLEAVAQEMPVRDMIARVKVERPDMKQIRAEIVDRTSPYYYPRLIEEFERNDTVMKLDKYRRLYLGYMFQEDYNPYRPQSFEKYSDYVALKESLTRQECDTVIKYAQMSLADNPFNLTQMSALITALKQRGRKSLAAIWQYKFNYILMAIASTGTGADEENAWYVIEPQHEYVLLNNLGYTVTNHLYYEPYYEYLTVVGADKSPERGFYFNIDNILNEYYRKFTEEEQ